MAEEEVSQEKGKSKVLIFAIIGILVFLILITVLVVVLLIGGDKKEGEGAEEKILQGKQNTPSPTPKDTSLLNIGPLYPMPKPIVVNLITQSGRRYLKVSVTFELSNPKMQQEVDQKITIIQDIVIDILSSKSIEEVVSPKGKEKIKDEILQRINPIFLDGPMKNIFFTDFVVQ